MKHFAIYILLVLCSCNPCKRLIRLCPPNDSISYIERIDTVIIPVFIPSSTLDAEIPLGSLGFITENEDQKLEVTTRNDTIFIKSTCKEDSLKVENYQLRKELASQKTIIQRVEIPTIITQNSKYHSTAGILAPLLLLALIGAIVLLFKR